jgi:hypothetical protein
MISSMKRKRPTRLILLGVLVGALALGAGGVPHVERAAHAAPNCATLAAQAVSAITNALIGMYQAQRVCSDPNQGNAQCAAALAVALSSAIWAWWTASQFYCQCYPPPAGTWPASYCNIIQLVPQPPKPQPQPPVPPGPPLPVGE